MRPKNPKIYPIIPIYPIMVISIFFSISRQTKHSLNWLAAGQGFD